MLFAVFSTFAVPNQSSILWRSIAPHQPPLISIESIPTNQTKKTSGDLWRSPATGYTQFYNQHPLPPKSLYFGEKNVADCYSCSSRTQSIPPQSHQKLLETIGNLQPMQRREFAEQRTFNFLTFFIYHLLPSSRAGSLENKGHLIN